MHRNARILTVPPVPTIMLQNCRGVGNVHSPRPPPVATPPSLRYPALIRDCFAPLNSIDVFASTKISFATQLSCLDRAEKSVSLSGGTQHSHRSLAKRDRLATLGTGNHPR
jgi:hypothetical protein